MLIITLIEKVRKEGSKVKWNWGRGTGTGTVQDIFDHEVTHTIRERKLRQKGKPDNRALFIKQENGSEVLKLESEVEEIE